MVAPAERKVVLVTRRTRLEDLVARYHTLAQARFYIEHLGADLSDYLRENEAYARSLRITVEVLQAWGRYQVIDRGYLPNFVFAPDDIVVVYLRRKQTFEHTTGRVDVEGVLEHGSWTDPDTGFVSLLRIRDAAFGSA